MKIYNILECILFSYFKYLNHHKKYSEVYCLNDEA